MKLRYFLNKLLVAAAVPVALLAFSSCFDGHEPDYEDEDENVKHAKTSILIYAVASNNLYYNFLDDKEEMRKAASSINLKEADVLIYAVTPNANPQLSRLVDNHDGTYGFKVIKDYDRSQFSTDPERISAVIDDYVSYSKTDRRGLVLWSHATGWSPSFSDHVVPTPAPDPADARAKALPAQSAVGDPSLSTSAGMGSILPLTPEANHSFGQDKYEGVSDRCDLKELSAAIPSDTFDFIWFDCCYMSQIEVFYEMRHKADYFIASPTELAAEGMPYDITLPFIAKDNYNLLAAVDAEAEYFKQKNTVYSIALIDASALEKVAEVSAKAVKGKRVSGVFLLKYSCYSNGPFYDFGQYTTEWGKSLGASWDPTEFESAMDELVIYKSASDKNWDRRPINAENFSGIGVHYYREDDEPDEQYYTTLDWFKRVYPGANVN